MLVGAYHFFSTQSAGASQAQNFIETVPVAAGALPPVVDIEINPNAKGLPPEAEILAILDGLLSALERHYGQKPILYTLESTYAHYLQGRFGDYPVWIRRIIRAPRLSDGRDWLFGQYSNRGRLAGYDGAERFIDLNVFRGTKHEIFALCEVSP